jgi:hypothetical protein
MTLLLAALFLNHYTTVCTIIFPTYISKIPGSGVHLYKAKAHIHKLEAHKVNNNNNNNNNNNKFSVS